MCQTVDRFITISKNEIKNNIYNSILFHKVAKSVRNIFHGN